jgi:hypothetical protein
VSVALSRRVLGCQDEAVMANVGVLLSAGGEWKTCLHAICFFGSFLDFASIGGDVFSRFGECVCE